MSAWFRRRLSTCCSVFVRVSVWSVLQADDLARGGAGRQQNGRPQGRQDEMARTPRPAFAEGGRGDCPVPSAGRKAGRIFQHFPHTS